MTLLLTFPEACAQLKVSRKTLRAIIDGWGW